MKGFPDPPTEEEMSKAPKHIALLAVTIDDMPYEHLWKGWCETLDKMVSDDKEQDQYYVSLLCHAKYPRNVQSEWLKKRLITLPPKRGRGNSFEDPTYLSHTPSWGSVEITRAMLDLMQDGLTIGNCTQTDKRFSANRFLVRTPPTFEEGKTEIPPADHFLFVSETCIPVATAPECFERIGNGPVSWVNARHRSEDNTPKNKYEDDQFAGIHRRVPGQYRWKADQWMLISSRHAKDIIGMDRPHKPMKHQLWQSFGNINASDEMYFPTALALSGHLRFTREGEDTQRPRSVPRFTPAPGSNGAEVPAVTPAEKGPVSRIPIANSNKNESILLRPITYTDWSEGMRNPATFANGVTDLKLVGKRARDQGCLVARKFATHIPIPGRPKDEQKITGEITVVEWNEVMMALREQEEHVKSIQPSPSESVPEVEGSNTAAGISQSPVNKEVELGQESNQ